MSKSAILAEIERRRRQRKLFNEFGPLYDHSKPFGGDNVGVYDWQIEFHNAGADHSQRCLMAANQIGKTRSGAAETAVHLTGEYPPWWKGRRFDRPVAWWTGAERTEDSKDIIQSALLGSEGEHGTGWIPKSRLKNVTYRQAGVPEVVDKIYVKHVSGGTSECTLKTYQMEARGWRGKTLDGCWLDEECKQDIFSEVLTRILRNKGIVMKTVTPVLGVSEVIRHFLNRGPGVYIKNVTWNDAPHLDEKAKAEIMESYPDYERDTRAKGVPMLGTGVVFPVSDESLQVPPQPIPAHWYRINGIDFGIDHPAAGAFCAWDKDADTFYVYDCYRQSGQTPVYHAAAMKKHGEWMPNSWPKDGLQRDKGSGEQLKNLYRKHGLYLLSKYAQYPEEERAAFVEPAVIEMYEYMRTGRFKVFSTLTEWFEEKRLYHRKDGKIVAEHDDILSATRYAFVMRRYAKVKPVSRPVYKGPKRPIVGGHGRYLAR